jgi:putative heme-binding domain-containing protein
VATAPPERIAAILTRVLSEPLGAENASDAERVALAGELAAIVGARRDPTEVAALIVLAAGEVPAGRRSGDAALLGLADGMARRGTDLVALVQDGSFDSEARKVLEQVFARCTDLVPRGDVSEGERVRALKLLAFARDEHSTNVCLDLVRSRELQGIKAAAAMALADRDDARIGPALLELYAEQTPAMRGTIREALYRRPAAALALLEAVQAGTVARAELGAAGENRLKQHRDASVRELAERVLTANVSSERKTVLADYQKSLSLAADPLAGKQLFRQHCAVCHKIGDVGVDVAPDISDSRVKSPQQLLTDILNPNQAIDNNYVSYTVLMADGNVHTGIIAAESASSVTLRQQENKTLTLLRADIEALRSSGVSLMPEGFEKHLSHQQMADLISFVKNWRYLDEAIPGTIGAAGAK